MTGSMQNFNCNFSDRKFFTILCNMYRKFCFSIWSINDRRPCYFTKIDMATDKISMKMCFKNIFDLCFAFIGKMKVFIYIT